MSIKDLVHGTSLYYKKCLETQNIEWTDRWMGTSHNYIRTEQKPLFTTVGQQPQSRVFGRIGLILYQCDHHYINLGYI